MTRSQIFTAAHSLAKKFVGNYAACFALALREVYAGLKAPKFPTFAEYGKAEKAANAVAAILAGGSFNGVVYAKNHKNGKEADVTVYVGGECYALGRIQLVDVAACKAEFLAAVQTLAAKTVSAIGDGSESQFGTMAWLWSGMNAE